MGTPIVCSRRNGQNLFNTRLRGFVHKTGFSWSLHLRWKGRGAMFCLDKKLHNIHPRHRRTAKIQLPIPIIKTLIAIYLTNGPWYSLRRPKKKPPRIFSEYVNPGVLHHSKPGTLHSLSIPSLLCSPRSLMMAVLSSIWASVYLLSCWNSRASLSSFGALANLFACVRWMQNPHQHQWSKLSRDGSFRLPPDCRVPPFFFTFGWLLPSTLSTCCKALQIVENYYRY